MQEEENGDSEKLIFDYLSDIIEECLPADNSALRDTLFPESPKYSPTEAVRKMLPDIDSDFFVNFLNQIVLNLN